MREAARCTCGRCASGGRDRLDCGSPLAPPPTPSHRSGTWRREDTHMLSRNPAVREVCGGRRCATHGPVDVLHSHTRCALRSAVVFTGRTYRACRLGNSRSVTWRLPFVRSEFMLPSHCLQWAMYCAVQLYIRIHTINVMTIISKMTPAFGMYASVCLSSSQIV